MKSESGQKRRRHRSQRWNYCLSLGAMVRMAIWHDHTLEIHDTANFDMKDINYDIRILDSPMEMRELILEKNHISHNKARILAGYCLSLIHI